MAISRQFLPCCHPDEDEVIPTIILQPIIRPSGRLPKMNPPSQNLNRKTHGAYIIRARPHIVALGAPLSIYTWILPSAAARGMRLCTPAARIAGMAATLTACPLLARPAARPACPSRSKGRGGARPKRAAADAADLLGATLAARRCCRPKEVAVAATDRSGACIVSRPEMR